MEIIDYRKWYIALSQALKNRVKKSLYILWNPLEINIVGLFHFHFPSFFGVPSKKELNCSFRQVPSNAQTIESKSSTIFL